MEHRTSYRARIAAEAAEWFVKLQDPHTTSEVRREGAEWMLRSPDNIEEYLAVARTWGELGGIADDDYSRDRYVGEGLADTEDPTNVIPLDVMSVPSREVRAVDEGRAPEVHPKGSARMTYYARAAAVVAVGLLGALGWWLADRWLHPRYSTGVGEQRTLTLEDGSVLQLNTSSEVRIAFDGERRQLELKRGEALFEVAKDPKRPFWVTTPQATVRAIGTVFNVRIGSQGTGVAVLEGRVEIVQRTDNPVSATPAIPRARRDAPAPQMPATRIQLAQGERAAVMEKGEIVADAGPTIASVEAWTKRRLVFREKTLASLLAEVNRYHSRRIEIADPRINDLKISGTFSADDLESLLMYLEKYRGIKVEQQADGNVLLRPAQLRTD